MKSLKKILLGLSLGLATTLACAAFPDKPVRLVIPSPAGGPTDTAARLVAEQLTRTWGQPVVVENKPGASGAIATEHVVKGPADGYAILLQTPILIGTELARPSVNYRTLRDLVPVTGLVVTPIVYVASNDGTKGGLKELIAAGRAQPHSLSYGSMGEGTTTHYLAEQLKRMAGVEMTHVPYAGESPVVTALLGGHIKSAFISGAGAKKAAETGKARILAVASEKRSSLLPEVPTLAELGIDGFGRDTWIMAFVPTGTPDAVVEQISRDIHKIVKSPDVQERMLNMGLVATGGTPAESLKYVQADYAYWVKLVKDFGVLAK